MATPTIRLDELDRDQLIRLGTLLDTRPASLHGRTIAMALATQLLRVRTKTGASAPLRANPVQRLFERRRGRQNIVLKARQLGLTTWAAARFFLKTITRPGTLTLQVAHTQESAEEIFRIVHRFLDGLPEALRDGPLCTSRLNVRQIVFPELDSQYRVVSAADRNAGRGLTAQNLHCSELARWPGDPAEILAGLRATLAPDAEVILESTPNGVGGCFYEEWQNAAATGAVRHFFPWWMEKRYRAAAVDEATLTAEEREIQARAHLDLEQIGFRRQLRAGFGRLARQEYAEDAEACFLAGGDSVFDLASLDKRLPTLPPAVETRRNGELQIWFPPVPVPSEKRDARSFTHGGALSSPRFSAERVGMIRGAPGLDFEAGENNTITGGKQYLVAVDPAGGGSDGDYSAAQVLELETALQCAEFAGRVGGLELARLITALAREYNCAWLVIERNNHGSGILALAETVCAYPRIYRQSGQPGWLTTSLSRPAMLGRLDAALIEQPDCFMSRRLLAECRAFVRHPDGTAAARSGAHDDLVMAMAIALAARAALRPKQTVSSRQ